MLRPIVDRAAAFRVHRRAVLTTLSVVAGALFILHFVVMYARFGLDEPRLMGITPVLNVDEEVSLATFQQILHLLGIAGTQRLGWDAGLDLGVSAAKDVLDLLRAPLDLNTTHALQLFGLGTAVIGVFLLMLWRTGRPPMLALYAYLTLAVPLLTRTGSAGGVRPRFVLVAFPVFMALAVRVHGIAFFLVMLASAGLLAATAIVYTTPLWVIP